MAKKYDAGVKEYRDLYWTPDYVPLDTDLLACFKVTGLRKAQRVPGVQFGLSFLPILSSTKVVLIASKMYRAIQNLSTHSSRTQLIYSKKVQL